MQYIQYKFVVASTDVPDQFPVFWEEGPNRIINLMKY
jgi:hypothetical protein